MRSLIIVLNAHLIQGVAVFELAALGGSVAHFESLLVLDLLHGVELLNFFTFKDVRWVVGNVRVLSRRCGDGWLVASWADAGQVDA